MTDIQGLQVVTLHVNDFEEARRFYRDELGLEEIAPMPEQQWAMYNIPGSTPIGIHGWELCKGSGGRPPGTVTGMVLTVPDAHAFAETIEKSSGSITDPVAELPWGPLGGTLADPSGNEIAFSEPPQQ